MIKYPRWKKHEVTKKYIIIFIILIFSRCAGDYAQAKKWHERQLDVALAARDKVGLGIRFNYKNQKIITYQKHNMYN